MNDDTTTSAGGRPPTIFELCQQVYALAAARGIDPLTVDECELWQVGGMLDTGDTEEDKRRREDAEVFQARIDAEERGEEYEPELVPFDPAALQKRGPRMPPLGMN